MVEDGFLPCSPHARVEGVKWNFWNAGNKMFTFSFWFCLFSEHFSLIDATLILSCLNG